MTTHVPESPQTVAQRNPQPKRFSRLWGLRRVRRFAQRRRGSGVALIVVLTVLAIMTTAVVDFSYSSRVQLQMAANERDGLRALYLARSAFNFARVILFFQNQLDKQLASQSAQAGTGQIGQIVQSVTQSLGKNLQLWRISILTDCQTLNSISTPSYAAGGGAYGGSGDTTGTPPPDSDKPRAAPNDASGDGGANAKARAKARKMGYQPSQDDTASNGLTSGEVTGLGYLPGNCNIEIDNENKKIQLWRLRYSNPQDPERLLTVAQLRQLLLPTRFDRFFQQRDPDGQYTTRDELIGAIADWIDVDSQGFDPLTNLATAAPEDTYYQQLADRYLPKNAPFDTMGELELVRGIGDDFIRLFGDQLTIYPGPKEQGIYMGDASPWLIRATICGMLSDPTGQGQTIAAQSFVGCPSVDPQGTRFPLFWQQFQTWYQQRLAAGGQAGLAMLMGGTPPFQWNDFNEFLTTNGVTVPTFLTLKPEQVFGNRVTTFKIKAHGYSGDTKRTVTAVVYNEVAGGQLWYYRED
jgi:general secretion pathway protein K